MVCRTDSLLRTARMVVWGVALVPMLASCQDRARQDRVTTQDGVTGGYVRPPYPEQAPIDYDNAKPMPMPSIDGPPVKPDPPDTEIKYPGPAGSEEGSAGERR
jgi:hypothetical protein